MKVRTIDIVSFSLLFELYLDMIREHIIVFPYLILPSILTNALAILN